MSSEIDDRLSRLGPQQRRLLEERLRERPRSGHQIVARTLADLGVTHVYGVPGQPVYDTYGACAEQGIRLIGTRHQHPAALMAAAHNYFAGRQVAVSILSTGPPAAHALAAAVVANENGWPLLLLAGAAPQSAGGAGYFMALDAAELYRPVTKSSASALTTGDLPDAIARALEVTLGDRPGAVLLELPEDTLTGLAVCRKPEMAAKEDRQSDSAVGDLQALVAALTRARRPLLVIGKEARWTAAPAELNELVESLAIPFITCSIARGALPDDHPLCMNAVPWLAQSQADLVILLGARLDWVFRYGQQIAADAAVVRLGADVAGSGYPRKPSLVLDATPGLALRRLLREIDAARRADGRASRDPLWVAALGRQRQRIETEREARTGAEAKRISPLRLAAELRDALPEDAISIFDSNLTMAACQQMIPASLPASRLTPGPSGCLGIGVPYAIAAKLAHPERAVVAICGDFAFGLCALELETAVRHQIPIVIVVANNDGNGGDLRQRMHLPDNYAEAVMQFQPGLRYDRLAEALGAYAEHVAHAAELGPALARAIASRRPACINVAVDPQAPFPRD